MELSFEQIVDRILRTVVEMVHDRAASVDAAPSGSAIATALEEALDRKTAQEALVQSSFQARDRRYAVLVLNRRLSTLKRMSSVDEFLEDSKDAAARFLVVLEKTRNLEAQVRQLEGGNVELFTFDELVVNPSRHVLVPRHANVPVDREDALLREYSIRKHELPKMYESDPMARYLGARAGSVVEVVRDSITSGLATSFRVVVPTPLK